MDKLQVFNYQSGKIKTILKGNQYHAICIAGQKFNRYDLLALAADAAYCDTKAAWKVLHLASIMFHAQDDSTFNTLYGAVASHISWIDNINSSEYSLHTRFKKAVKGVLGEEASIVDHKDNPKHRPDAWVSINGELLPVEIKVGVFDKKALKQLQRYIDFYNCKRGIAVGDSFNAVMPDHIIFVAKEVLDNG